MERLNGAARGVFVATLLAASAGCNALFDIEEGQPWPDDVRDGASMADAPLRDLSTDAGTDRSEGSVGDDSSLTDHPVIDTRADPLDQSSERDVSSTDGGGGGDGLVDAPGADRMADLSVPPGDVSDGSLSDRGDAPMADIGIVDCLSATDCAGRPHVRTNAPVSCTNGRCIVPDSSCDVGWAHCSSNPLEVCETDVATSARCGTCTTVCPESTPLCTAGACVGLCAGSTPDECAGTCVNLNNDPQHCGSCTNVCSFPNADVACNNRSCTMTGCRTGYGDCTNAAGCETRLNTLAHCALCNTPCGAPGDIASCATGSCVITCQAQPESCFNGIDDDCDNNIDCADPDCTAVASCEPAGSFVFGTQSSAAANCPARFTAAATILASGLTSGPSCTGCGCTPTTTTCGQVRVLLYGNQADCDASQNPSDLIDITTLATTCTNVATAPWNGFSATSSAQQSCTVNGSPTPPAPSWATTTTFCQANATSAGGCGAGLACVPKPAGQACLVTDGAGVACPAGFSGQTLYTGISDNRTCTTCNCTATGGTCASINIDVSQGCDGSAAASVDGAVRCGFGTGVANFSYMFNGAPTPPSSCSITSTVQGTVLPASPKTMCCR